MYGNKFQRNWSWNSRKHNTITLNNCYWIYPIIVKKPCRLEKLAGLFEGWSCRSVVGSRKSEAVKVDRLSSGTDGKLGAFPAVNTACVLHPSRSSSRLPKPCALYIICLIVKLAGEARKQSRERPLDSAAKQGAVDWTKGIDQPADKAKLCKVAPILKS